QDAFDVAVAGDDHTQATETAVTAMAEFTQLSPSRFEGINPNELRHSLFSFAAGATLEDIRFQITPRLFSILQEEPTRLHQEAAVAAAKKEFNVDTSDLEGEEFGPAFLGSSSMHSPRKLRFSQVPGSTVRSPLFK
ncbi:MAG: hypothetical protein H0V76_06260, partial [Blastocatellia bacterium]|nr:hypothetical protein [Blastocatellia bacterium]